MSRKRFTRFVRKVFARKGLPTGNAPLPLYNIVIILAYHPQIRVLAKVCANHDKTCASQYYTQNVRKKKLVTISNCSKLLQHHATYAMHITQASNKQTLQTSVIIYRVFLNKTVYKWSVSMSLDVLVSKLWFCLCVLWQTSKSFLCSCRVSPGRSVCKSKSEKVLHHKIPQTENSPQLEVSYKSPKCFTIWTSISFWNLNKYFLVFSWPSHLGHAFEIRFWEFPFLWCPKCRA